MSENIAAVETTLVNHTQPEGETQEMKKFLKVVYDYEENVQQGKLDALLEKVPAVRQINTFHTLLLSSVESRLSELATEINSEMSDGMKYMVDQLYRDLQAKERLQKENADLRTQVKSLTEDLSEARASLMVIEHEKKLAEQATTQAALLATVEKLAAEVAALKGGATSETPVAEPTPEAATGPTADPEALADLMDAAVQETPLDAVVHGYKVEVVENTLQNGGELTFVLTPTSET